MAYLILVLILGLPFAPLLFHSVDIWHSEGFFSQVTIWLGFGLLLFGAAKQRFVNNIPLFLLFLWIGYSTAVICHAGLQTNKYNTTTFFPFFNLLTVLLLYYMVTNYLPKSAINWVIQALQAVAIFNALLCSLQLYGLAQFTKLLVPISPTSGMPVSQVIGFIGNGTHLSAFIGMMLPVLFINTSRRNILAAILSVLLLTQTGEIREDVAATGWIILFFYILYVSCKKKMFLALAAIMVGAVGYYISLHHNFVNFNGRLGVWTSAWTYIQDHYPLTGMGLGTMNKIALTNSMFYSWRHLHQEFIQYTLEIGIIGLVLILNIVWDMACTKSLDRTETCLKMSFFGFLVSCCLLSSSHLWVMSIYATVIYSLFKVVHEENKWQLHPEKKSVIES